MIWQCTFCDALNDSSPEDEIFDTACEKCGASVEANIRCFNAEIRNQELLQ